MMATHIYGLLSLVLTLVFFYIGFQQDPTWRDLLLWAAGWMSAFMFALFLLGALRSQRKDAENAGKLSGEILVLNEKVRRLKYELNRRNQTLDVVAGFGGMAAAKVREVVEGEGQENG